MINKSAGMSLPFSTRSNTDTATRCRAKQSQLPLPMISPAFKGRENGGQRTPRTAEMSRLPLPVVPFVVQRGGMPTEGTVPKRKEKSNLPLPLFSYDAYGKAQGVHKENKKRKNSKLVHIPEGKMGECREKKTSVYDSKSQIPRPVSSSSSRVVSKSVPIETEKGNTPKSLTTSSESHDDYPKKLHETKSFFTDIKSLSIPTTSTPRKTVKHSDGNPMFKDSRRSRHPIPLPSDVDAMEKPRRKEKKSSRIPKHQHMYNSAVGRARQDMSKLHSDRETCTQDPGSLSPSKNRGKLPKLSLRESSTSLTTSTGSGSGDVIEMKNSLSKSVLPAIGQCGNCIEEKSTAVCEESIETVSVGRHTPRTNDKQLTSSGKLIKTASKPIECGDEAMSNNQSYQHTHGNRARPPLVIPEVMPLKRSESFKGRRSRNTSIYRHGPVPPINPYLPRQKKEKSNHKIDKNSLKKQQYSDKTHQRENDNTVHTEETVDEADMIEFIQNSVRQLNATGDLLKSQLSVVQDILNDCKNKCAKLNELLFRISPPISPATTYNHGSTCSARSPVSCSCFFSEDTSTCLENYITDVGDEGKAANSRGNQNSGKNDNKKPNRKLLPVRHTKKTLQMKTMNKQKRSTPLSFIESRVNTGLIDGPWSADSEGIGCDTPSSFFFSSPTSRESSMSLGLSPADISDTDSDEIHTPCFGRATKSAPVPITRVRRKKKKKEKSEKALNKSPADVSAERKGSRTRVTKANKVPLNGSGQVKCSTISGRQSMLVKEKLTGDQHAANKKPEKSIDNQGLFSRKSREGSKCRKTNAVRMSVRSSEKIKLFE